MTQGIKVFKNDEGNYVLEALGWQYKAPRQHFPL